MEQRDYVVHDEEEASSVLTAVDMSVMETNPSSVCFPGNVRSEALSKHCFARAHIASYDYSLSHFPWKLLRGTEELREQT
jgi:hypothetical protein